MATRSVFVVTVVLLFGACAPKSESPADSSEAGPVDLCAQTLPPEQEDRAVEIIRGWAENGVLPTDLPEERVALRQSPVHGGLPRRGHLGGALHGPLHQHRPSQRRAETGSIGFFATVLATGRSLLVSTREEW